MFVAKRVLARSRGNDEASKSHGHNSMKKFTMIHSIQDACVMSVARLVYSGIHSVLARFSLVPSGQKAQKFSMLGTGRIPVKQVSQIPLFVL